MSFLHHLLFFRGRFPFALKSFEVEVPRTILSLDEQNPNVSLIASWIPVESRGPCNIFRFRDVWSIAPQTAMKMAVLSNRER